MHELSVTQSILKVALENAEQAQADRIVNVNLVLGQLSDEREESIQFYWNELAAGTAGQDAELHFRRVAAEMKCADCGSSFTPTDDTSECPTCLSPRIRLISGDDIRLESIDVE